MFLGFKLSFVGHILEFFGLETVWATFKKLGDFFQIFLLPQPGV